MIEYDRVLKKHNTSLVAMSDCIANLKQIEENID